MDSTLTFSTQLLATGAQVRAMLTTPDRRRGERIRWSCTKWEVGKRLGSWLVVMLLLWGVVTPCHQRHSSEPGIQRQKPMRTKRRWPEIISLGNTTMTHVRCCRPSSIAVAVVRVLVTHDRADRIRWSVGKRLGSWLVVIGYFIGFTANNALHGLVSWGDAGIVGVETAAGATCCSGGSWFCSHKLPWRVTIWGCQGGYPCTSYKVLQWSDAALIGPGTMSPRDGDPKPTSIGGTTLPQGSQQGH